MFERRLREDVYLNLACRCFCRLNLSRLRACEMKGQCCPDLSSLVGGGTRRRDLPNEDGNAPGDKEIARFTSDFSPRHSQKKIRAVRKGKRRDPEPK